MSQEKILRQKDLKKAFCQGGKERVKCVLCYYCDIIFANENLVFCPICRNDLLKVNVFLINDDIEDFVKQECVCNEWSNKL